MNFKPFTQDELLALELNDVYEQLWNSQIDLEYFSYKVAAIGAYSRGVRATDIKVLTALVQEFLP